MLNKIRCALIRKLRDLCHWTAKKLDIVANSFIYRTMNEKDRDNYIKYSKRAMKLRSYVGELNAFLIKHK